jgi:signal transduction histidine kinase/ActR/RegA family two-component response regulator
MKAKFTRRVGVLVACAIFYFAGILAYVFFQTSSVAVQINERNDRELQAAAAMVPHILGDDYHDRAIASDSISESEETEITMRLASATVSLGVTYLYSIVENAGAYYVTADSTDKDASSGETIRRYYYHYQDIPPQLVRSLHSRKPVVTNSRDQVGEFRTAAIPYLSNGGNWYLACSDRSAEKIAEEIYLASRSSWYQAIYLALLALPLFHLIFYYYLRLARVNEELIRQQNELEITVARRTIELEKTRDDLLKNREQLLLALQTGKISIFKWNLRNEDIDFTQSTFSGLDRFKGRHLSIRLFKRLVHDEDREEVMGKLARYVSGSVDEFNVDCRLKIDRETYLWVHIIGKIIERSATGIGLFMVGILEDISDLKARESALQQSQKLEAVGQLAGGIAHDFNNMLQAIIGYAEMIKLSLTEEDENFSIVDLLIQAALKSQSLVRQLLTFSRMSQETRENLDLNKTLNELVKMLRRLMGDRIELKTCLNENLPYVVANSGQLEQVIMNLCVNSRDAIDGDGQIIIRTEEAIIDESFCFENPWARSGRFVKITVADNGPGIPEENRKKVFEPFFTTKGVGKGTGLGLAIVYGVIQKHEGFINLVSETGKGAAFQIFLPASEVMSELQAHSSAAITENLEGTETILLAEDAELVRNFAGKMLRKAGYKVIFACDGQEAVEQFKANSADIDVLVFDIVMPRMTGKVAYEHIKEIRSDVPVVFCSGYHEEILDTGFYSNFNGTFLPKPYKTNDLLKKIRSLLDGKK